MPSKNNKLENIGYVQLPFIKYLQKIQIIMLPPYSMNELYLDEKHMDIPELELE